MAKKMSKKEARLILQALEYEEARTNYAKYCQIVNGPKWVLGRHLQFVCKAVEMFIDRKVEQKILILSMPPQHGKSQSITEVLPSWFIGKTGGEGRVISLSYGDDLASRFGRRNKSKVIEFGKAIFGIELSSNKQADKEWEIEDHDGGMVSAGIMAGVTGKPADLIVIDDPIKNRMEAESETYRENLWNEYLSTVDTRLSANGLVVVIMTRWHEDDLVGKLMKTIPDECLKINIPLEPEEKDVLGRGPNEALFPEIGKDYNWLLRKKKLYISEEGTSSWESLYNGKPVAAKGNLIPVDKFKYYEELPEHFDQVIQSWDCTFKDSDGSDFVVGTVWGRKGTDKYLIDLFRARMDFESTLRAILLMTNKYPQAFAKLIEDKANGSAIISTLRKKIHGIMPVEPHGSKLARCQSILPEIRGGYVYLPQFAAWLPEFVKECKAFPKGSHDDQVDSMTQALDYLRSDFIIEEPEKKAELPFALQSDQIVEGGYVTWN